MCKHIVPVYSKPCYEWSVMFFQRFNCPIFFKLEMHCSKCLNTFSWRGTKFDSQVYSTKAYGHILKGLTVIVSIATWGFRGWKDKALRSSSNPGTFHIVTWSRGVIDDFVSFLFWLVKLVSISALLHDCSELCQMLYNGTTHKWEYCFDLFTCTIVYHEKC